MVILIHSSSQRRLVLIIYVPCFLLHLNRGSYTILFKFEDIEVEFSNYFTICFIMTMESQWKGTWPIVSKLILGYLLSLPRMMHLWQPVTCVQPSHEFERNHTISSTLDGAKIFHAWLTRLYTVEVELLLCKIVVAIDLTEKILFASNFHVYK